jgi:hypothetical protein|tara:strand:+ start:2865 stop:3092 length:228 start_codon:yes stop_codon:yes gene_type:complete
MADKLSPEQEFNFEVELHCDSCDHEETVLVRERDYNAWAGNGVYIQDAFYYLSAGQRELMISNTCDDCWKKLYGE